jgi:hypothetical protein
VTLCAIFHREASYFLIRTIAHLHSGCSLTYKTLNIKGGKLYLKGVVASKPDFYLVNAEQISISYDVLNSFQILVESPQLTLSPEILKSLLQADNSTSSLSIEIVDGVLDWTESVLASASFNLKKNPLNTRCNVYFERGSLSYRDGIVQWEDLPIEWVSFLAQLNKSPFPVVDPKGTWSGNYDGEFLHAEISDFVAQEHDCIYKGSFVVDWQKPSFFSISPESLRICLQDGQFITPYSSIQHIELLATYQAGKWGMCECKAKFGNLPFSFSGKGFFATTAEGWMDGTLNLGAGTAQLLWSGGASTIECEGVSHKEIGCLQDLAQVFDPRIAAFQLVSGSFKCKLSLQDILQLESVEVTDLYIKNSDIQIGCKKLSLSQGDWSSEAAFVNGFQGGGTWSNSKQELLINGLFETIPVALSWNLDGSAEGHFGDLRFLGNLQLQEQRLHAIVHQVEGLLPDFPQIQGRLVEGSADLFLSYSNGIQVDQWEATGRLLEGAIPGWSITGVELNLIADNSVVNLNANGFFTCSNGLMIRLNVPKIRIAEDVTQFDLRLEDENCYFLRAVGSKQGPFIQLDNGKSHFLGSKLSTENLIWGTQMLSNGHVESRLHWPLVSLFLEKIGLSPPFEFPIEDLSVEADFNDMKGLKLALEGGGWKAKAIYRDRQWNVTAANEQIQASCNLLMANDALLQVKNGRLIHNKFLSLGFEGKILENFSADLLLTDIVGDLNLFQIDGLQGPVQGHGCVTASREGIVSDLDIQPTSITWKGFQVESLSPIHLYCSSENGVLLKGLDVRASKGTQEARGKVGLIEFNKKTGRIAIQKGAFHLASDLLTEFYPQFSMGFNPKTELDLKGTFDFSTDFSEINCTFEHAFLPIAGQMRQFKDLQVSFSPKMIQGSTSIAQREKWANISFDVLRESSNLNGLIHFEEKDQIKSTPPLSIAWSSDPSGIAVHSIEGNFAGLKASFKSAKLNTVSELVGNLAVDFNQFRHWIDPEVDIGLQEIGVGSGYELKGTLTLDRSNLSQFNFKGILGGKQIQLFDFQFRTFLSNIDIGPEKLEIRDIVISDSSVSAKINHILMESKKGSPWTIQMPLLTLEDLRPSLLRKLGDKEPTLSPLIVREFILRDFHGLLDDGKTYKAKGELSFVNTFKREETFFDLPSNFFGRIIGLDLDLLVPVIGNLTFELKDGFFQLQELKHAYSEGQRSEFFLVDSDAVQRVDLRGNLEILVKMKQFVLFALTEGLVISIDGSLSHPHVSLQKRLKFE